MDPTPHRPPAPPGTDAEDPRWTEVRRLADLLDSRFRIPGTQQTFGVDAIVGVIPGIGDAVGLVAASVVVSRAVALGARGWTLANMLLTMALDATVGSVPVLGTVFDVVYKANTRNVRLLEDHVQDAAATRDRARRTVLRSIAVVVLVTLIVAVALVGGLVWLLRAVF